MLNRITQSLLSLIVAVVLLTGTASAAPDLSPRDLEAVHKAEAYLNDIKTLVARFLQVDGLGEYTEGTVYMNRPGKMRLEYDPPSPVLVVADGTFFIYYDKELDQISHLFLSDTPAGILLDDTVDFLGDKVNVVAVRHQIDVIEIDLVQADDPGMGLLTLVFTADPFRLRQWRVRDAQGQITTVSLFEAQTGMTLDDALFRAKRKGTFD